MCPGVLCYEICLSSRLRLFSLILLADVFGGSVGKAPYPETGSLVSSLRAYRRPRRQASSPPQRRVLGDPALPGCCKPQAVGRVCAVGARGHVPGASKTRVFCGWLEEQIHSVYR